MIYSKKVELIGIEEKIPSKPREKAQSESKFKTQTKLLSNSTQKINPITTIKIIHQKPKKEIIQQLPKIIKIKLKTLQQETQKRLSSLFLLIFSSLFIILSFFLYLEAEKRREEKRGN